MGAVRIFAFVFYVFNVMFAFYAGNVMNYIFELQKDSNIREQIPDGKSALIIPNLEIKEIFEQKIRYTIPFLYEVGRG